MSEADVITTEIVYPDSDGQPMAENTEQFQWIVVIKDNLESLFADDPQVFVAGDLLWYPVEGRPDIRRAPDVLVAIGRPKGRRGSYQQWLEGDIAPQVVFEVLSPSNDQTELALKFEFYDLYGVEEYYLYNPDSNDLVGWLRRDGRLRVIETMDGWISPRLGIRFTLTPETLRLAYPNGQPFLTFVELREQAVQAEQRAVQAEQRAVQAEQRATQAEQQREQERQSREQAEARAARLAAQLRALGIDPAQEQEAG